MQALRRFSLNALNFQLYLIFFSFTRMSLGSIQTPLKVVTTRSTPNGFSAPPRGWNTFGLQANPEINPSFAFNQSGVIIQADALLATIPVNVIAENDYYISLDSGWSVGDHGDEFGRIIYDSTIFDILALASYLHTKGLKLGVYVLPGAFCNDDNKTIYGTGIPINATLSGNNNGFARCDFDFTKDGVQQWHDSVVNLFVSWGVDLIKLDFITPGSPSNNGNLPPDNSGSVIAYHKAIAASNHSIRLDISWKLERNSTFVPIWEDNADSMRTDQDINNSGQTTFIQWSTVQRAIDNYRDFINRIVITSDEPVSTIFPDMDNLFVGNAEAITGVPDKMRETIASHWIGAAANLITGSDLTRLDALGMKLLADSAALETAAFTAKFPMQPRNPGTGRNESAQLQAWIAGPNENGDAVVVLANYGPDEGQGGFGTTLQGKQVLSVTWDDLGFQGSYNIKNVWTGKNLGTFSSWFNATLDAGESLLLSLSAVQ